MRLVGGTYYYELLCHLLQESSRAWQSTCQGRSSFQVEVLYSEAEQAPSLIDRSLRDTFLAGLPPWSSHSPCPQLWSELLILTLKDSCPESAPQCCSNSLWQTLPLADMAEEEYHMALFSRWMGRPRLAHSVPGLSPLQFSDPTPEPEACRLWASCQSLCGPSSTHCHSVFRAWHLPGQELS